MIMKLKKITDSYLNRCAEIEKFQSMYEMMNQWVRIKQKNKRLDHYLSDRNIKNIAIYGMNSVGMTLLYELEDSSVKVSYGIDQRAYGMLCEIELYAPDMIPGNVDAVIVTAIRAFPDIKRMLNEKYNIQSFSLEDILFDM